MIGKHIANGSSCEVFEWNNDGKVIKLFHMNTPLEAVQQEYHNSSVAWKNGLPAPRPVEQVIWDGRPGIIFEKVIGETLVNRLFRGLYTFKKFDFNAEESELRIYARVLNDIHRAKIFDIVTNQKAKFKAIIGEPAVFTRDEISAIHAYIDRLPEKQQLCHGDTNLSNVILIDNLPVMIDWMHASCGNPVADVAEVCVTLEYAVLPPDTPVSVVEFFEASRRIAYRIFLDEYCKLSGVSEEEIRAWYVPAAARSIASGALPNEQIDKLVEMIRFRLSHREN
jgi:aminoglycoside phosphotransferase (APT) family kinase protein